MLKLDTPITVGSKTYTHMKLVSAEWRAEDEALRNMVYQFCTVEGGIIRIGSIVHTDNGTTMTDAPEAFRHKIIASADSPEAESLFTALRGIDALIDDLVTAKPTPTLQEGETITMLNAIPEPAPNGELPGREIIDNRTED